MLLKLCGVVIKPACHSPDNALPFRALARLQQKRPHILFILFCFNIASALNGAWAGWAKQVCVTTTFMAFLTWGKVYRLIGVPLIFF